MNGPRSACQCSPTCSTNTARRIPSVCIFPSQKVRACIHKHLHLIWCVGVWDVNHSANNLHMPDSLAFLLMMFLATRLQTRGLMVRSIMETIAADSMRYFLVIFSSHFVLLMTLNLGPVRTAVPPFGLLQITSNVLFARNRSNFFRARKSQTSYPCAQLFS